MNISEERLIRSRAFDCVDARRIALKLLIEKGAVNGRREAGELIGIKARNSVYNLINSTLYLIRYNRVFREKLKLVETEVDKRLLAEI